MIESIAELSDNSKTELVASLAVLLAGFGEGEVDAEKLQAIATASGNSLDSGMATLFATVASKCPNGISKDYMPSPGGGGGGGGYVANIRNILQFWNQQLISHTIFSRFSIDFTAVPLLQEILEPPKKQQRKKSQKKKKLLLLWMSLEEVMPVVIIKLLSDFRFFQQHMIFRNRMLWHGLSC